MGFNNLGVLQAKQRLVEWNNTKSDKLGGKMIVGGNIGKNKMTPNEDAWKDYEICFKELFDTVDYFVVNVSSPNTPGLRELQEKDSLTKILANLQNINQGMSKPKPLLLKIARSIGFCLAEDLWSEKLMLYWSRPSSKLHASVVSYPSKLAVQLFRRPLLLTPLFQRIQFLFERYHQLP
jgi:hypothetical protein